MTTCSATETTLDPETSRTWMPCSTAALRSMWSDPTPAVTQSFRFFAYNGEKRKMETSWSKKKGGGGRSGPPTYLLNQVARQVAWMERSGDEDLGLCRSKVS